MLARLALAALLALVSLLGASAQVSSLYPPSNTVFTQVGSGIQWTGASAAGAEVSLLGTGQGSPSITCDRLGATYRIDGGGSFSTALTPGDITPKVRIGSGSVSRTITNLVASANNARWTGLLLLTCVTIGSSGTILVNGEVTYATGDATMGSAPLHNGGVPITLDNTGPLAVDVRVLMVNQNANNIFRLNVFNISRLY